MRQEPETVSQSAVASTDVYGRGQSASAARRNRRNDLGSGRVAPEAEVACHNEVVPSADEAAASDLVEVLKRVREAGRGTFVFNSLTDAIRELRRRAPSADGLRAIETMIEGAVEDARTFLKARAAGVSPEETREAGYMSTASLRRQPGTRPEDCRALLQELDTAQLRLTSSLTTQTG